MKIDLDVYKEPLVSITLGGETKELSIFAVNRAIRPLLADIARAAREGDPKAEYVAWDAIKEAFGFPGMSEGQVKECVDAVRAEHDALFALKNGSGQPLS